MQIVLESPTPHEAREATASALDDQLVPVVDLAKLLTSELVANAIEHGGGANPVYVVRQGNEFRVEVFDESQDTPVVREVTPDDPRGRGIYLVDQLSAHWSFHLTGNGKSVCFRIDLPKDGSAARQSLG